MTSLARTINSCRRHLLVTMRTRGMRSVTGQCAYQCVARGVSRGQYGDSIPRRSLVTTATLCNTIDADEVQNFENYAQQMWSERGEYELLHLMNKLRVPFIVEGINSSQNFRSLPLEGRTILDVGCGGGILSEPLARLGAKVTGIDASEMSIKVAKLHSQQDPDLATRLQYLCQDVLDIQGTRYDALIASEVVEHVSDLDLFLDGCCRLVKPGGSIFLTTMNRTRLAYFLTISMAENVLGLVPQGMHDWNKYVTPSELEQRLTSRGFSTITTRGMMYNPVSKEWSWQTDLGVNYALHAVNMDIDFDENPSE